MKAVLVCLGIALAFGACKKSSTGPTPGGGGGGGTSWLVGTDGLMVNVSTSGTAQGYDLSSKETLNRIACRYAGEAWVVGTHGTLLYTDDAGATWRPQPVPASANLRGIATQDAGPVFVAGDGVLLTSTDTGAHWTPLGDGRTNFVAVAAAQGAETALAVSDTGAVFSIESGQLVGRGSFAGARAVAISPDGDSAILVGDHLITRSSDGGRTWTPLPVNGDVRFDDVRIGETGEALAVGSSGTIAHIMPGGAVLLQQIGLADLHAVHLADGDDGDDGAEAVGFAAGDSGRVFITRNGGSTWSPGPTVNGTVLGLDMIGAGHL
jgi:photosystem II stability/assembly factor-like uncharacterized protein